LHHVGRYYTVLLLNRESVSRVKLCLVSVFPDIVNDYPKMKNLPTIFLRSFENVAPQVSVLIQESCVYMPLTACGRDKTGAARRPSSKYTWSTAALKPATRERSLNWDRRSADSRKRWAHTDNNYM